MNPALQTLLANPESLQAMVDVAEGALALDAARLYGFVEGGYDVDTDKCVALLDEAAKLGIYPSADAIEKFALQTMYEQKVSMEKEQPQATKPKPVPENVSASAQKHQDALETWIARFNQFVAREGHGFVPNRLLEDGQKLGVWVTNKRAAYKKQTLSQETQAALENLDHWHWEGVNGYSEFLKRFQLLKAFYETHGHFNIPQSYQPEGIRLAPWLAQIRSYFRRGELKAPKIQLLDQLPGWTGTYRGMNKKPLDHWLKLLSQFARRKGHAFVPSTHVEDGEPLGNWVKAQKANRKQGRMSKTRMMALENIKGRHWGAGEQFDQFHRSLATLKAFAREHGHARVPPKYRVDGLRLGKWVIYMRSRKRSGNLHPQKIKLLEQVLGWDWNPTKNGNKQQRLKSEGIIQHFPRMKSFEHGIKLYKQFFHREKHGYPMKKHIENGHQLGVWVKDQRGGYKASNMSHERAGTLHNLPGWQWEDPKKMGRFYENLDVLKAYIAEHGHPFVPAKYKTAKVDLGLWVPRLRRLKRTHQLDQEFIDILESTPGWSWASQRRMSDDNQKKLNQAFQAWLKLLRTFVDREGHGYVPFRHKEQSKSFGYWVSTQRTIYQKNILPHWKEALLNEIPEWRWSTKTQEAEGLKPRRIRRKTDAMYPMWIQMIQSYSKEHGHCRIPDRYKSEGKNLGVWVRSRRTEYRKGILADWKMKALSAIPGWQW